MELTVAIAHQQHSVVDEPGAAEGPERVSNPMAIELTRKRGVECQPERASAGGRDKRRAGLRDQGLTCMPKALMATEIGPFWASQAAISERGRHRQWLLGPSSINLEPPRPPLTVLILAQLH